MISFFTKSPIFNLVSLVTFGFGFSISFFFSDFFFTELKSTTGKTIYLILKIFEFVFEKHHLSNFNLSLPNQYQLFKKLIINRINS